MAILHYRSSRILDKLIASPHPLFIKDIALEFGVSERTIKYDLKNIRELIQGSEISLEAKPNKGVWIEGIQEGSTAQIYDQVPQESAVVWSIDERQWMVIIHLLLKDEYMTIQELADIAGVSRNTIYKHLEEIEAILAQWGITFERTAHKGLRAKGDELAIRATISYGIQNFLHGNDMSDLLAGLLSEKKLPPRVSKIMSSLVLEPRSAESIYRAVRRVAKKVRGVQNTHLTERTLLQLFVTLCVVAQRVRVGHILPEVEYTNDLIHPFYQEIKAEIRALDIQLGITFDESEIRYICLQGFGYLQNQIIENGPTLIPLLVDELINDLSYKTGLSFGDDLTLRENLEIHLDDRLTKYQNGILVPNPLKDEIIRTYGDLFQSIKQACNLVLGEQGIFLNDADLAYITLHFQTSYERYFGRKKYKALVICSTGRGSASLLQTRLENEIKNLMIVGCCSIFEVEKGIELSKPDVVISVLPLETALPTIVVNAILTQKDVERIYQELKKLTGLSQSENLQGSKEKSGFGETLDHHKKKLLPRDFQYAEALTQEVINQGFQISTRITKEFHAYLTDEAIVGLTIHTLHMVNRITFGHPYVGLGLAEEPIPQKLVPVQEKLLTLLQEYYPEITDSELLTILRYFQLEGKKKD